MHVECNATNANNRAETRREQEVIDGSASPDRVLQQRGGPGPGICESDGSASGGLCCALAAAAAGGYSYMRMMQAAMGVAAGAAAGAPARAPPPLPLPPPPPPRHAEMVEPGRGPGIKQPHAARPGADDGEHAHPPSRSSSKQRFTFLGFVVAPGPPPPCCSRDHPFEVQYALLLLPPHACLHCVCLLLAPSVGEPRMDRSPIHRSVCLS